MNSSYSYPVRINSNVIGVYYNKETSSHVFKINVGIKLSDLNDQLDQINHCLNRNGIRVGKDG